MFLELLKFQKRVGNFVNQISMACLVFSSPLRFSFSRASSFLSSRRRYHLFLLCFSQFLFFNFIPRWWKITGGKLLRKFLGLKYQKGEPSNTFSPYNLCHY